LMQFGGLSCLRIDGRGNLERVPVRLVPRLCLGTHCFEALPAILSSFLHEHERQPMRGERLKWTVMWEERQSQPLPFTCPRSIATIRSAFASVRSSIWFTLRRVERQWPSSGDGSYPGRYSAKPVHLARVNSDALAKLATHSAGRLLRR